MVTSKNLRHSKQFYPLRRVLFSLASFAILIAILLAVASNSHAKETDLSSQLVTEILTDTEEAIAILRIEPKTSLFNIKSALEAIEQLEAYYKKEVSSELKEKGNTVIATSYTHFYPSVDLDEIYRERSLPTLSEKIDFDVVFNGDDKVKKKNKIAYFDYSFAKASLKTAKDAIGVEHDLEAMSNLRRVFEAVYLNPSFNVSSQNP